ncbi:MAG TPA: hypothetical protein VM537_35510, partial [Anaerolineae bacterium]|nr:hypothetical protein [Anaerolineae bacterium]
MNRSFGSHAFRLIAIVCLSIGVAIGAGMWAVTLRAAPGSGQPNGQPLTIVPPASRPGIYAAFDLYNLDPEPNHLTGGFYMFNWSEVENLVQGVYDWGVIDAWIERQAANGKAVGIGITTYNGPSHNGVEAMPTYVWTNLSAVWTGDDSHKLPRYWSAAYKQPYRDFVQALGDKYRNDPRVEFIAIGTGMFGETRAWYARYNDDADDLGEGVNSQLMIDTFSEITDYYVSAFSEGGVLKKVLLNQTATGTFDAGWRYERTVIADYSVQRGVGISLNGLYPENMGAIRADTGDPGTAYTGLYDQLIRYDGPADDMGTGLPVPSAWETYDYMIGCDDATTVYWALLNGLDKHADYFRLHADLFAEGELGTGLPRENNLAVFDWAAEYMGATLQSTPSIWVAMRDVRAPWQTCWQAERADTPYQTEWQPQYGNYDFWLYQVDSIAGGQT